MKKFEVYSYYKHVLENIENQLIDDIDYKVNNYIYNVLYHGIYNEVMDNVYNPVLLVIWDETQEYIHG